MLYGPCFEVCAGDQQVSIVWMQVEHTQSEENECKNGFWLPCGSGRFVDPPFASSLFPDQACEFDGRKGWGTHSVVRNKNRQRGMAGLDSFEGSNLSRQTYHDAVGTFWFSERQGICFAPPHN
jgi:hypothetical protein